MPPPIPDDVYERMAVEAMKALMPTLNPNQIAEVGWDLFIKDVFDLTDALTVELLARLARNRQDATVPE
jgi:hypothetical protein